MKRLLVVLVVSLAILSGALGRTSGRLTNARVQATLNKWIGNRGSVRLKGGILEQGNTASADVVFTEFHYDRTGDTGRQSFYKGPGTAYFVHYNDGRWVLKQVMLSDFRDTTFRPEIEVR